MTLHIHRELGATAEPWFSDSSASGQSRHSCSWLAASDLPPLSDIPLHCAN